MVDATEGRKARCSYRLLSFGGRGSRWRHQAF